MEIKVRELDPVCVKKIDELARKKKMSRNAYLKSLLENYCVMDGFKKLESKNETLLTDLKLLIKENTDVLQAVREIVAEE